MTVARRIPAQPLPQRLRPMALADLDAVMAVEVRAYSHPWSRGNFVDSVLAGYLAEVLTGPAGEVVGYFVAMQGVDEMHLLNITVAPEYQSTGLGQCMMKAIEQHVRQRLLSRLWLEVRQSNERARSLYRRLGFVEVGIRKGYYPAVGPREDAVVMRLALAPEPA